MVFEGLFSVFVPEKVDDRRDDDDDDDSKSFGEVNILSRKGIFSLVFALKFGANVDRRYVEVWGEVMVDVSEVFVNGDDNGKGEDEDKFRRLEESYAGDATDRNWSVFKPRR